MTPKEKAIELVKRFANCLDFDQDICEINCALICVDEIKKALPSVDMVDDIDKNYWNEVEKEIIKL